MTIISVTRHWLMSKFGLLWISIAKYLGYFILFYFLLKKKSHSQNPPYPIEFHAILTTNEGPPHLEILDQ